MARASQKHQIDLCQNSGLLAPRFTPIPMSSPNNYTNTAPTAFSEDGSTSFSLVLNRAPSQAVNVKVTLSAQLTWMDGSTAPKITDCP